jgi:glycosyltransferase involved in cell wall biosynthesis
VRPYLLAADALVFPSYREGFPNVVLQAGAMGLPAIVTDINGCNEIITEGINGTIIPPRDEEALKRAMITFIEEPEKVHNMATKARPLITSRYEQRDVWEALRKMYESL